MSEERSLKETIKDLRDALTMAEQNFRNMYSQYGGLFGRDDEDIFLQSLRKIHNILMATEPKQTTCGFITDAKGDFVTENDTLEREITIRLNAKHKNYGKNIIALDALLHEMQKEADLVRMVSGL